MNSNICLEKIFPYRDKNNIKSLSFDNESISFVTNLKDSNKIGEILCNIVHKYHKKTSDITIVDATACLGCDTLTFCKLFGYVFPIEENKLRYDYLVNNLNVFNITNAYPTFGNSLDIIPKIEKQIDIIYIDPPWGGKNYKNINNLELTFGNKDLDVVVKDLFKKSVKIIALKLPKNYCYHKFIDKLGNNYYVVIHNMFKKINLVTIEKKL
jgi:16S rRNA G966 N2-methylase RsmD